MSEENLITLTEEQLYNVMKYVVHTKDCELVKYRGSHTCTCGVANALGAVNKLLPTIEFNNHDIFGGTSVPKWLVEIAPHKQVIFKPRSYNPGPMSDG